MTCVIVKTGRRNIRSGFLLLTAAVLLIAVSFNANAGNPRSERSNSGNSLYAGQASAADTIILQLTRISDGIVQLQWTYNGSLTDPFDLIRTDGSPGNSDTLYKGRGLIYLDTITFPYCDSINLGYRVVLEGVSGLVSNSETDIFIDNNDPFDPVMDSITIDPDGHPVVSWLPSSSNDVGGYDILQLYPGSNWLTIGSTHGAVATSFKANSITACDSIITFAILTRDKCGNRSTGVGTYPKALNTLKLDPLIWDDCKGTTLLNWNNFNNMIPALGGYQIYRKEGMKPDTMIGFTNPGVTTFTDILGFTKGSSYMYYVRAISTDGSRTSTSCKPSFISDRPLRPDTLSLSYVTVRDSRYVELGIYFSPPENVNIIRVFRSETENGRYDTIMSVPPGISSFIMLNDTTAEVNQRSYYYKVDAADDCDVAITSDVARTIYLTCLTATDASNTLNWNDYEGWSGGVDHYNVNRYVNNSPDPGNPIGSQGSTTYFDASSPILKEGNIISYQVEAFGKGIPDSITSLSNIVQALRPPVVMMPNAFAPRGINRVFRPKMLYVENADYKMIIFNKWGQQIFSSSDPSTGWDGMQNGEYVPVGIYFYRLEYSSYTGEILNKSGSVIVVQ